MYSFAYRHKRYVMQLRTGDRQRQSETDAYGARQVAVSNERQVRQGGEGGGPALSKS